MEVLDWEVSLGKMKTGKQRDRAGEVSKNPTNPVRLALFKCKEQAVECVGLVRERSRRELGEAAYYNPACRQRGQFWSSLKRKVRGRQDKLSTLEKYIIHEMHMIEKKERRERICCQTIDPFSLRSKVRACLQRHYISSAISFIGPSSPLPSPLLMNRGSLRSHTNRTRV